MPTWSQQHPLVPYDHLQRGIMYSLWMRMASFCTGTSVKVHQGSYECPLETWSRVPQGHIYLLIRMYLHTVSVSFFLRHRFMFKVPALLQSLHLFSPFLWVLMKKKAVRLIRLCVHMLVFSCALNVVGCLSACLYAFMFACVSCVLHGGPHSLAATQLKSSGTVQTHPWGTSSAPEFPSPHAWGHPYSFPPLIWGKWWKAGFFPIFYFLPRLPAFQCNVNLLRPENMLPFGHDQFHVISITACQKRKRGAQGYCNNPVCLC